MALLERISVPVTAYPLDEATTPDGDVGQQVQPGAPVQLRGYFTPTDNANETTVIGQAVVNTGRLTLRDLAEVDPKRLRHATFEIGGRRYIAEGEPERHTPLRRTAHWKIRLREVPTP